MVGAIPSLGVEKSEPLSENIDIRVLGPGWVCCR
jgi:hypothetical protein